MTSWNLTPDDVTRLLEDPSGESRIETAEKISAEFNAGDLTDSERDLIQDIFRIMVNDAEIRVREALALQLKENSSLPRDVARSLAADADSVALPILQYSEVLTDDDLIEFIAEQDPAKQVAIAKRHAVSEGVSMALVESGDEAVVTVLVANDGAVLSEPVLNKVVDNFPNSTDVKGSMVRRSKLPITVVERLVTLLAENLKEELIKHQELPSDMATDLLRQVCEVAIVNLSSESTSEELKRLVRGMRGSGRLTPSLVMRALCMGDLSFFEIAVSELARIPLSNARVLIHDSGPLGLRSAYRVAGLPHAQFPAARAAIDVAHETAYDGGNRDRERFSRRIIERMLTQYGDLGVHLESDDLAYLLSKMRELPGHISLVA